MKLIQKAVPDPVFRSWVANLATLPTCSDDWDRLRLPEKGILRTSLLKEQGYICCYCQSRVDDERCHIEHLIPRKVEPEKMFEYDNVLASCNGGDDEDAPVRLRPLSPHIPEHKHYLYRHCGHKRQRDELLVTPLDTNCSAFFTYSSDGRIDRSGSDTSIAASNGVSRRFPGRMLDFSQNRQAVTLL